MNDFIEPKIRPLVEALTSCGIKTYSSCEGHEDNAVFNIPHVAFKCEDNELLADISGRLLKTIWRLVLNDKFTIRTIHEDGTKEYGMHYTLRPIPSLSGAAFEDLQAEIPEIAKKLKESDKPQEIKNNYPVLQCPDCGNESFNISGYMDFDLEYPQDRVPQLCLTWVASAEINCEECSEEIEVDDPFSLFSKILERAEIS